MEEGTCLMVSQEARKIWTSGRKLCQSVSTLSQSSTLTAPKISSRGDYLREVKQAVDQTTMRSPLQRDWQSSMSRPGQSLTTTQALETSWGSMQTGTSSLSQLTLKDISMILEYFLRPDLLTNHFIRTYDRPSLSMKFQYCFSFILEFLT